MITLGLEEHAWLGFTTFAAFVPVVRTKIDGIDLPPRFNDILLHPFMDLIQAGHGHGSTRNSRLVGDKNNAVSSFLQKTQCFPRARKPLKFLPGSHIMRLRRLLVQYAITIKNDSRPPRKKSFRQRQPSM